MDVRRAVAESLAVLVKRGAISRTRAVQEYRNAIGISFIDSLTDIDIAIGNVNEGIAANDNRVLQALREYSFPR